MRLIFLLLPIFLFGCISNAAKTIREEQARVKLKAEEMTDDFAKKMVDSFSRRLTPRDSKSRNNRYQFP